MTFSQVHENKQGGICFRFDDNLPLEKLKQVADIFNKYKYKYCLSVNLDALPDTLEYLNFIRKLDRDGFEIMDHCPNHGTHIFWSDQYCFYADYPGVDHLNNNMVCLKHESISSMDTGLILSSGYVSVKRDTVISFENGGFKAWDPANNIYFPSLNKFGLPTEVKNINSDDPDTLKVRSFWNEEVDFGHISKEIFYAINVQSVRMTETARSALAEESLGLFERYGLQRPHTWVQPGGRNPIFTTAETKAVFGDRFNYTSAATNGGLLCYNDVNVLSRFSMQWGGFSAGVSPVKVDKKIIADKISKHYLLIGGSHFWDIPIDWNDYLGNVDSLLSWCFENNIPVKTYREWSDLIYDTPQNPYTDIFPKLTMDLNTDDMPDGYELTGARLDKGDAPFPSDYSLSITKRGSMCKINALAGLEKGENDLVIWTKGSPGNFITLKIRFQESKHFLSFRIPAESKQWIRYSLAELKDNTQKIIIPDGYSYFHFEFECSEYHSGIVKIGGIEFRKKAGDPLYVISVPDTILYIDEMYEYRVLAAKLNVNDALSFELVQSPSWLRIDSTGLITGTHDETEDDIPVHIRIRDRSGNTAEQLFRISVEETPILSASFKGLCMPEPPAKPVSRKLILASISLVLSLGLLFLFVYNRRRRKG